MKYSKSIYFIVIFFTALITYDQYLGLNGLLIPIIVSGTSYFLKSSIVSKQWIIASALWILSGLGIFLWHLDIGLPLFILTSFHYFSITYNSNISFPTSILQTLISLSTGIIRFFNFKVNTKEISTINESSKQLVRKLLLITIPLIVFIIFLKLYQSANPEFERLTSFINLNFIKLPFFFYFGLLSVLSFGLFFFKPSQKILESDLLKENQINEGHYDDTKKTLSIQLDWQLGLILVSTLSLLLIAFIAVDIQSLFNTTKSELSHSQNVHQGINILIVSIILVIIIIMYLFRGRLNFKPSKSLKLLTYFWLFLNAVLVLLIIIKNNQYIGNWGLTHKRIGVYVYLSLCLIGLSFTTYKITTTKSTSFLIERVSITFLSILVLFSLLNWNGIIAKYNLNENNLTSEKIDFAYLAQLGPEAYPIIIRYIETHPNCGRTTQNFLTYQIHALNQGYSKDWTHFLSYTYSGYKAYQITKNYNTSFSYSSINF